MRFVTYLSYSAPVDANGVMIESSLKYFEEWVEQTFAIEYKTKEKEELLQDFDVEYIVRHADDKAGWKMTVGQLVEVVRDLKGRFEITIKAVPAD